MKCLSFFLLVALPCLAYSVPPKVGSPKGCPNDFTTDHPVVKFVLDAVKNKYGEEETNGVDIFDCTRQTVAGARYRFKLRLNSYLLCDADVWVPPNESPKLESEVECKSTVMPGGLQQISIDDKMAQEALKKAVTYVNNGAGDLPFYITYASCVSVTRQVVAGYNIRFHGLQLAISTCTKEEGLNSKDLSDCPVDKSKNKQMGPLDVTVYIPAVGEDNYEVTISAAQVPKSSASGKSRNDLLFGLARGKGSGANFFP